MKIIITIDDDDRDQAADLPWVLTASCGIEQVDTVLEFNHDDAIIAVTARDAIEQMLTYWPELLDG